jgi:predicted DNA-binding protein (MmcQ/YjbR family)
MPLGLSFLCAATLRLTDTLAALCWMRTREQIREREKWVKEANRLNRNEWMTRALRSEAADERIRKWI